jgi:S1-C subfamily serine protease
MMTLTVGANTPLHSLTPSVEVRVTGSQQLAEQLGVMWLALDAQRQPACTPAYLQTATDWATAEPSAQGACWRMDLNQLPESAQHLMLVLYSYSSLTTLGQVSCQLTIQPDATSYVPQLQGCTDSAMIVLELYCRQGQWKARALADGSAYGLAVLGRRLSLALDEKHPTAQPDHTTPHDQPSQWTGTAFAISPRLLLTCAHVTDGAREIQLNALHGRRTAHCIAYDRQNDVAILSVNEADLPVVLPLHQGRAGQLGESVTTLGYPLSGLVGSHLQVTQGCISSLRGIAENSACLQFTAPIQSGSSGSPLLDQMGQVVGMVIATMSNTQNMNFAVKHYLLWALLDSVGFEPALPVPDARVPLSPPQLVKQAQQALWHVSCQR